MLSAEDNRILSIGGSKKHFHGESVVHTTHFLKKLAIQSEDDVKLTKAGTPVLKRVHAFNRGVLNFEDFNYEVFNPHILVN